MSEANKSDENGSYLDSDSEDIPDSIVSSTPATNQQLKSISPLRETIYSDIITSSLSYKKTPELNDQEPDFMSEADGIVPLSFSKVIENVEKYDFKFGEQLTLKKFPKINYDVSLIDQTTIEFFLIHVHEEENKLFLFGKNVCYDKGTTICIEILEPVYYLYFYPIFGREDMLIDEVRELAIELGGYIIQSEFKKMKYCFGLELVDNEANWLEVCLPAKCDIKSFPQNGKNYSLLCGTTYSLAENFEMHRGIKGPQYLRASNLVQSEPVTFCPMFSVTNIDNISPVPTKVDYLPPPLNVCTIALGTFFDEGTHSHHIYLISCRVFMNHDFITYKENIVHTFITSPDADNENPGIDKSVKSESVTICRNEKKLLTMFVRLIDKLDIDLLCSYTMLSTDISILFDRMKTLNVQDWYRIGRVNRTSKITTKPNSQLCLSGRIPVDIRTGCQEFLKLPANDLSSVALQEFSIKRQQIDHLDIVKDLKDPSHAVNYVEYHVRDTAILVKLMEKIQLLELTFRLSQVSGCSWAKVLTSKMSYRCESILLHTFKSKNFVLPDKKPKTKAPPKKGKFRGGTVLQPKKGFYDTCVALLDFNSLYPSVICEYNLCFTTVDRRNPTYQAAVECPNRGVLPGIMEDLTRMRNELKEMMSKTENSFDSDRLYIKQQAIKFLSNAIYGYLGYSGSRFESNEIAALVTERGRAVLQDTVDTVESSGKYSVIYGDTDSVMVNTGTKNIDEAIKIAESISTKVTNKYKFLKLAMSGIFTKMLLVTKKKYAVTVYDSPGKSHREVKGLDMVRRDWCQLTKYLSSFVLDQMMNNDDRRLTVKNCLDELANAASLLKGQTPSKEGQLKKVTKEMLIIYRQLNKRINEYSDKRQNPHVSIAMRMIARGDKVPHHATIPMIVACPDVRELSDKVKLPDEISDISEVDSQWYLVNQILPPIIRLFAPYGSVGSSRIAQSLGLTVLESSKRIDNSENTFNEEIPHTRQLYYNCLECGERCLFTRDFVSSFRCGYCNITHSWKPVCNRLVQDVRSYLTESMQCGRSGDEIHSTLRFFLGIFTNRKIITEEDEDYEEFRQYMERSISRIIDSHAYNHIDMSTMILFKN